MHGLVHGLGVHFEIHTFPSNMPHSNPGDYVSDTPPESGPDYNCQIGRDTCSGGDGRADDVTNFMNFGDDNCIDHFTTLVSKIFCLFGIILLKP